MTARVLLCGCTTDGKFCHEHKRGGTRHAYCCGCTSDAYGPVYCDAHRPVPPEPPEGACCLCHRLNDKPMVTGKGGIKWHAGCAS